MIAQVPLLLRCVLLSCSSSFFVSFSEDASLSFLRVSRSITVRSRHLASLSRYRAPFHLEGRKWLSIYPLPRFSSQVFRARGASPRYRPNRPFFFTLNQN